MTVRMKDIAESLNLSIVTVSKALRNHPDIAKATRQRILDKTKEMNYRPNLLARSLVTGKSSLIGLIVPDLIHPFFSEVAKSLSVALRKRNWFLIVASSDGDPALEEAEIEHMLAHRLDALVVASTQPDSESLRRVSSNGPPLVLLDRDYEDFKSNFVGTDNVQVGSIATEHLISLGRKRIAHLRGPENRVGIARLQGYKDALQKHSIPFNPNLVVMGAADGLTRGGEAMEQLLKQKQRPDAIFCFNDTLAIGVMAAATKAGLQIPKDLAVIGCGNYHYGPHLQVALSSIDQNVAEVGARTAKMIFSLIDAETGGRARRAVLEPRLVARRSTVVS